MNIKFCYKDEIHKTFLPPSTFKALLEEIKVSFGDRLPSNFILQYRDKDGDLITMSSDREYSSMLRFDAPRTMASVKIFIVPAEKSVETSFEVIDASPSFSEGGVSEFSLSSRLNSQGNKSPDRTPYGSPQKDKSLSFSDDEGDELQLTSPTLRDPVPLRNDSTNELYKTRTSIEQQRLSMPSVKSVTKNKERTSIPASGKAKELFSQTDQSAPLGCFEDPKSATIRSEIDRFMAELPNKKSKKSISQAQTQENQAVQRIQRAFRAYNTKKVPSPTTLQDVTNAIHKVFVDHTGDGASSYVPVQCQQVLFSAIIQSLSPESTNHYSPDPMTQTNGSSSELMMSRESASNLKYEDYHLRSSFPQQAEVNDSKTFELYNYQAIVGMSSSILFITDDDGQGITYKTIYLKNTGFKPWRKCLIEPCGVLTGKVAEINNLEVGDVALVTLELTGYFNVGIYSSQWRIIHEDDDGAMETVGESLKVDFIIEESNIVTTKGSMTSPKFENYVFHSFEERQKPVEEESEEDHGNESEESGEQASSNGGPYSKEYLEYREQITNKAKEMNKIFPLDSSDEILRFVMGRPGLSLDDLTTAYLARKAGL